MYYLIFAKKFLKSISSSIFKFFFEMEHFNFIIFVIDYTYGQVHIISFQYYLKINHQTLKKMDNSAIKILILYNNMDIYLIKRKIFHLI